MKPLGHKAYGHIPHFSGSRMGPADKHCHEGQQLIMTMKARDKKDLIIVQEKLDGSCCSIAKHKGKILALTRSGYLAHTSQYQQHLAFDSWVVKRKDLFERLLFEGDRIVGEWILQAHGTRYATQHEPFVAFDIMRGHERMTYHDFLLRVLPYGLVVPRLIHIGQPFRLVSARKAIETSGHGAIDPVEGFVYRCEREGSVDFLCKWVRSDKVDGKYLPSQTGKDPVWNITKATLL